MRLEAEVLCETDVLCEHLSEFASSFPPRSAATSLVGGVSDALGLEAGDGFGAKGVEKGSSSESVTSVKSTRIGSSRWPR